jgi:RimJ/RimL family protein N-acetyltransferase
MRTIGKVTDSVTLRRLEATDAHTMAALQQDESVQRFLGRGSSTSTAESSIQRMIDDFDRIGWGLFAIVGNDASTFLGFAGFIPCAAIDSIAPELVCAVLPEFRRSCVAIRACEQAMDWGFATHGWSHIYACVADENAKVFKLAKRLRMSVISKREDHFDGLQTVFAAQPLVAT